jgi:hypothetical protein
MWLVGTVDEDIVVTLWLCGPARWLSLGSYRLTATRVVVAVAGRAG